MPDSTLAHEFAVLAAIAKGDTLASLGPSDSTDSGSDIQLDHGLGGIDTGDEFAPTSNPTFDNVFADSSDGSLDTDTDRSGTGERASAGSDPTLPRDVILHDEDGDAVDGQNLGDTFDSDSGTNDESVNLEAESDSDSIGANALFDHAGKQDADVGRG